MLRVVYILLVYAFLLSVAFSSQENGAIFLKLSPFSEPFQISLGALILITGTFGLICAGGIGLVDRAGLVLQNRKLRLEIKQTREELQALRRSLTLEKDPS